MSSLACSFGDLFCFLMRLLFLFLPHLFQHLRYVGPKFPARILLVGRQLSDFFFRLGLRSGPCLVANDTWPCECVLGTPACQELCPRRQGRRGANRGLACGSAYFPL